MNARHPMLLAVLVLTPFAAADEIVFDGPILRTVRCEIYKETPARIHYIDPAKDQCFAVSRNRLKRIIREDKPVLDLQAFLKRKAGKLSARQQADLRAAISAAAAPKPKVKKKTPPRATRGKRPGKLKMRALKRGVTILRDPQSGTPELLVDPFAEEDGADGQAPSPKTPVAGKQAPPSKSTGSKPERKVREDKP